MCITNQAPLLFDFEVEHSHCDIFSRFFSNNSFSASWGSRPHFEKVLATSLDCWCDSQRCWTASSTHFTNVSQGTLTFLCSERSKGILNSEYFFLMKALSGWFAHRSQGCWREVMPLLIYSSTIPRVFPCSCTLASMWALHSPRWWQSSYQGTK